jgi:DNA-binding NarL/FixJ family response regulator
MDGFFTTRTILICPEKLLTGRAVAQFLNRKSLHIERAPADADKLLKTARAKNPVLIIFSDEVEGMSPEEICRAVRGDSTLKGIQLLLLTEQLGDDVEQEALMDVDARLVAPVDDEQIIATIGALLEVGVRRGPRVTMEILASVEELCEDDMEGATTVVNILNLGETGLLAESPFHLKVGAEGSVRFRLPGSSEVISSRCVVMMMSDELTLQYGIEFLDMGEAELKAISKYVREQAAG